MLAGQIGRDAAIATRLAQARNCELHIAAQHANPTLMKKAQASGGCFYQVKDICDQQTIAKIAAEANIELVWINQDDVLANDVVSAVRRRVPGVLAASPTKEGSRIEWDKFDSRSILENIDSGKYNPRHYTLTKESEVKKAIDAFAKTKTPVAIKPRGLTGGKGVKVMGPHLKDYKEAATYARQVLADPKQGGVLVEEKMTGHEFTVQAFTDGKTLIVPPATYDYPYREDGDLGPGTGGMGCFTMPAGQQLPFITMAEYQEAIELMQKVLKKLDQLKRDYKGVLYGSFFKTPQGLKVVEFNARIGDPEGINIMELLDDSVDMLTLLQQIATRKLRPESVRFKKQTSVVIYLVSPDYAYRTGKTYEFEVDLDKINDADCRAYFAAAEQIAKHRYRTVGSSRTVAIATVDKTPWQARAKLHSAIKTAVRGPLIYRKDIANKDYIAHMTSNS